MYINKVLPYWTDEERQRKADIQRAQDAIFDDLQSGKGDRRELLDKWSALEVELGDITSKAEERYIHASSKKTILADVQEIVNAVEKTDFQEHIAARVEQLGSLISEGAQEDSLSILKRMTVESYENCCSFILLLVRVQLNALAGDEEATNKVFAIIGKRVSCWYINPQPAFIPMAHGKATDAFALMNSKNATIDRITGTATIDKFGVQLAILKLKDLHASLGISTDKLLSMAIAIFTQQNDFRHTKTKTPRREITISLKEYAQLLGYDVEEHETSTPEEAAREKKRAKAQLDNARRAIRKDLDILHASTLTWEEPIKGKSRDFVRVSLVTTTGIRNGEIKISFSPEIAGYLAERNLITQYPVTLLKISGRQPTAYYIGRKLAEHYNMDNNHILGTYNRIGIPALLAATDLDSYEEVQKKDRGHWQERIKEPLEKALDTLTEEGYLKDWEYVHAKGIPLTDEQAKNITSYEKYAELYLLFTLTDAVDPTERIAAKREAKAKAAQKTQKKKRATKKKD